MPTAGRVEERFAGEPKSLILRESDSSILQARAAERRPDEGDSAKLQPALRDDGPSMKASK
jgi:hypothetical protein